MRLPNWMYQKYLQEISVYHAPRKPHNRLWWILLICCTCYVAFTATYCVAHKRGIERGKIIKAEEVRKAIKTHAAIDGYRAVWATKDGEGVY